MKFVEVNQNNYLEGNLQTFLRNVWINLWNCFFKGKKASAADMF